MIYLFISLFCIVFQYDLENMIIGSHKGGEICRKFNPGIWIWYSQRNNHQSLNLKLGKVQIDNQLESIELSTRVVFSELESRYSGDLAEGELFCIIKF